MTRREPTRMAKGGVNPRNEVVPARLTRLRKRARGAAWISAILTVFGFATVRFNPAIATFGAVSIVAGGLFALVAGALFARMIPVLLFTENFKREIRSSMFFIWINRLIIRRWFLPHAPAVPRTPEEQWAEFYTDGPGNPYVRGEFRRRVITATLIGIGVAVIVLSVLIGLGIVLEK